MFTFIPLLIDGGTYISGMMIPGTVASLRAVQKRSELVFEMDKNQRSNS